MKGPTTLLFAAAVLALSGAMPSDIPGTSRQGIGTSAAGNVQDELAGFRIVVRIEVGQNPHQIFFTPDGTTAYIAAAGSDQVAVVDATGHRVTALLPVANTPLGVAVLESGVVAVSQFGADQLVRLRLDDTAPGSSASIIGRVATGEGPSLIVGPLPGGVFLLSAERANRLWVLEADTFALRRDYPTGDRAFPPAATSDGRLAFVPGYDDGTVTVIDLWNERVLETVQVGERPSGGAVLPGDIEYAIALRGEDRVAFINTASHRVVGTLREGIGESPFSVVVAPDGRLAFVNNTASHDVSVIALPEKEVVARIPVGEIPIVMAVHPSGETLWVSSEGSHDVTIVQIPERWRATGGS